MDFWILRPLSPKTGYHFFEGGLGGVKSFRSEGFKQWGSTVVTHNCWLNGNTADQRFCVAGSNPDRLTLGGGGGGGGAKMRRLGFEPSTLTAVSDCLTTRPLPDLKWRASPLLGAASVTDKKPERCVSV